MSDYLTGVNKPEHERTFLNYYSSLPLSSDKANDRLTSCVATVALTIFTGGLYLVYPTILLAAMGIEWLVDKLSQTDERTQEVFQSIHPKVTEKNPQNLVTQKDLDEKGITSQFNEKEKAWISQHCTREELDLFSVKELQYICSHLPNLAPEVNLIPLKALFKPDRKGQPLVDLKNLENLYKLQKELKEYHSAENKIGPRLLKKIREKDPNIQPKRNKERTAVIVKGIESTTNALISTTEELHKNLVMIKLGLTADIMTARQKEASKISLPKS